MATKKDIITLPHDDLRQRSQRIHIITDEVKQLIADMEAATLDWEDSRPHELGVALAAVQIDRLERIVIVRNDFDNKDDRSFTTLINPEIVKFEGQPELDHEGCLSVRDIYALVPRYPKVRVKALDVQGREVRVKAEGFLARILQHEIDHTNGILFVDHVKDKDAFFTLTNDGQLEKVPYEQVQKTGILR
ncbi:peptide deformylase [Candidatus Saccharibacteria bacterium]|nr:MAG: peptide deformylase [Candidatus Saccharibacteria bacterium]